MYIQKIESDLATVSLSVVELALLTQACGAFTVKKGTSAEQALVESMGAGFHGAAMAASSIDVLLGEDVDRVQRQWQRNGLLRNADGTITYPTQSLAELKELVGSDVYLDGARYEAMGVVLDVASNGVTDSNTGASGAVIQVGIDALVELEEADGVTYAPVEGIAVGDEVYIVVNGKGHICLVEVVMADDLLRLIDIVKKQIFIINRVEVVQRGHEGYPD